MRDIGNADLSFPYSDPSIDSGIVYRHDAQPAPAFEPIPQSPACLGLRGAAFYLAQRPHLPPSKIPAAYPLFPSLLRYYSKIKLIAPFPFPISFLCSISTSLRALGTEEVLIRIRKHRWEQSGTLRLSKVLRNKRQLIL